MGGGKREAGWWGGGGSGRRVRGWGVGGGGGSGTINVKEAGIPPVQSNLCTAQRSLSTAVQNRVTKTQTPDNQLLEFEAKDSPTH